MSTPTPDDERLRALLDDAVADVEPDYGLDRIRSRTRPAPRRSWWLPTLGALTATAATIAAVVVLSDRGGQPGGPAADGPTASASPEPSTRTRTAVPVYYVGTTPAGPRLFREFHATDLGDGSDALLRSAVQQALTGKALDPDYRSDWPAGTTLEAVHFDGIGSDGLLTLDLANAGTVLHDRPASLSQAEAAMALEQLIYTAQAATQTRAAVQLLVDGKPTDTLLGQPAAEPLSQGAAMDVQSTVWVTAPQDGDTVSSPFTVTGRGAFFEAHVAWQLLRGGSVVQEGSASAQECCTLAPYKFQVTADPGDYVLRVYDQDMSGGESGRAEVEDTKRVTVR